jgi:hypothetical protein
MPKKGQWFLIDSLKLLSKSDLEFCDFYLFGSAPPNRSELEQELKRYILESNLENIIHVHEIIESKLLNFAFSVLIKIKTKNVICVSEHVRRHLLFSRNYKVVHNGIPDISNNNACSVSDKIKFVLLNA